MNSKFISILRIVWFELKSSTSRSFFSIYWITLGFSLFVMVKSFVFSQIFNQNFTDYTIYLSCSLAIWFFLSGITTGGCAVYTGNKIQKMMKFPKNYFLFHLYIKKTIEFFLQLLVFLIFAIFTLKFKVLGSFLFLLNLIILLTFLYPFVMNLAYISLVSKDFSILVGYLMRVFFFITPVIWSVDMISENYQIFFELNPYYHFLEILRNSLLEKFIFFDHYFFLIIFSSVNLVLFFYLSKKIRNHELYI